MHEIIQIHMTNKTKRILKNGTAELLKVIFDMCTTNFFLNLQALKTKSKHRWVLSLKCYPVKRIWREDYPWLYFLQWDSHYGYVQGSAKRWALGCVNSPPTVRGSQEAGFTQPRAHLIADPCRGCLTAASPLALTPWRDIVLFDKRWYLPLHAVCS